MTVTHPLLEALATLLIASGAVLLVVAAWGVVVLPDALSRQHSATKAGSLALALVCVGVALFFPHLGWLWRMALVLALLLITLPVAAQMLARAAVAERRLAPLVERAEPMDDGPIDR